MAIEIRNVRDEELVDFVDSMTTSFLERPDATSVADELRPIWDLKRTWAALDDGRVCGTFRSWPTEMTVPGGGHLKAAAVSGVTVKPTHRRRGILRQLAAAEHAAIEERGEAVAILYASEYPIYGRFGYGPGTMIATWSVETRGTAFHRPPTGSVEIVSGREARPIVQAIHDQTRPLHAGEIRRRDVTWDGDLGLRGTTWGPTWKGFIAIHRDDAGRPDGFARYRAEQKWTERQPRSTLSLDDLQAVDDDAYRSLWQFLVEIDWVSEITAEQRSPGERLPWLLVNARAARMSEVVEGLWVRLFDVAGALAARTYEVEASVVLDIVDEPRSTRQRLELEAGPDGATCRPTDRSADLTLDVADLGAAYLGGTRLRDAVAARGVDEHRAGALRTVEQLLRTTDEPWCSIHF